MVSLKQNGSVWNKEYTWKGKRTDMVNDNTTRKSWKKAMSIIVARSGRYYKNLINSISKRKADGILRRISKKTKTMVEWLEILNIWLTIMYKVVHDISEAGKPYCKLTEK